MIVVWLYLAATQALSRTQLPRSEIRKATGLRPAVCALIHSSFVLLTSVQFQQPLLSRITREVPRWLWSFSASQSSTTSILLGWTLTEPLPVRLGRVHRHPSLRCMVHRGRPPHLSFSPLSWISPSIVRGSEGERRGSEGEGRLAPLAGDG